MAERPLQVGDRVLESHDTEVWEEPDNGWWGASCSCNWVSELMPDEAMAAKLAEGHDG